MPVRKGRHLPSLPKAETEQKMLDVMEEKSGRSSSTEESGLATLHKIYETLDSLSSPQAPERPAWSLAVPNTGLVTASPLYLMVAERRQSHTDPTISEISSSKNQARVSVTDTAKKVIKTLSESLSNKLEDGKRLCARESQTESESDCDDVFT